MSQMVIGVRLNPANVPQEIIDKVMTEEVRKARESVKREYAARIERYMEIERKRNEMLTKKAQNLRPRPKNRLQRIASRAETALATVIAFGMCIPEIGENLGLWVDERKEGDQ